jgi:hypothetical protein
MAKAKSKTGSVTKAKGKAKARVKASPRGGKRAAPPPSATLSPEDVQRVLKLLKHAGSVELKLSVPESAISAATIGIGLDTVECQPRQAFFFDTPDLKLNQAGLIVRARRMPGGRADTVVKLRPVDPATIDRSLRRSDSFKVELDAAPGGFVCSASFKGTCGGDEVLEAASGSTPLKRLFSKEQLAFFVQHAPKGVRMDSLILLGPILLLRAKHLAREFGRNVVVELWIYPDGSHVYEVSTKSEPKDAFQVAAEFRAYLAGRGIVLGAPQESKTRSALGYFKARLDAGLPLR